MNLKVTRNNIQATHGTIAFTASSQTAGTVTFTTRNNGVQGPFNYTLTGAALNFLTIDLSTAHLVLNGNTTGHRITYTSATGTATVDSAGNISAVSNGRLQPTGSAEGPGGGDDSWIASSSTGEDLKYGKAKA